MKEQPSCKKLTRYCVRPFSIGGWYVCTVLHSRLTRNVLPPRAVARCDESIALKKFESLSGRFSTVWVPTQPVSLCPFLHPRFVLAPETEHEQYPAAIPSSGPSAKYPLPGQLHAEILGSHFIPGEHPLYIHNYHQMNRYVRRRCTQRA
jgi:hypothetical protein